ncbi:MAG: ABC transporter permease [Burkholderiales bacterium]|nr:ABC transporter permease [Burkholderiales bacterium]
MSRVTWVRLAVVAGALAALEAACRSGLISPHTLVPPSVMLATAAKLLQSGEITADLLRTLRNVLAAFVTAVAGGFFIGVVLHAAPPLRRVAYPFLASYYAIPVFALYPALIVVFGMGDLPIIVIGFLFAVVAMIINTLDGLDRIPRVLLKTARVMRMGPVATALRIKLPSAAPHLFTGTKLAVAYSFIGVIAAEFILSGAGLGYAISYAYNNFNTARMYALMLLVITLVIAVNLAFYTWEQRLLRRRNLR